LAARAWPITRAGLVAAAAAAAAAASAEAAEVTLPFIAAAAAAVATAAVAAAVGFRLTALKACVSGRKVVRLAARAWPITRAGLVAAAAAAAAAASAEAAEVTLPFIAAAAVAAFPAGFSIKPCAALRGPFEAAGFVPGGSRLAWRRLQLFEFGEKIFHRLFSRVLSRSLGLRVDLGLESAHLLMLRLGESRGAPHLSLDLLLHLLRIHPLGRQHHLPRLRAPKWIRLRA